jgi:hypothetical protein
MLNADPQPGADERPQQQRIADVEDPQPGHQLGEQDGGRLRGKHLVTPPMVGDAAGDHAKHRVDAPVNPACQPATRRTGHDKRANEAAPRGKHEQGADNRDHQTGSKRHHHGISSTVDGHDEPTEVSALR